MSRRPNTKLTPRGRETLVARIESGTGVTETARQMGVSRQTASKWHAHNRRYERERPGELARVDARKVARMPRGGGHRALGRGCGSPTGAGTSCLNVAVDDNSRPAHAEQLPDEKKATARAFTERALEFFGGPGVEVERVTSTRCSRPAG